MFTHDTINPLRILDTVKKFLFGLGNRGEVAIPFIESVAEESRPAVTNFITNSGITSPEIANFKTFDEFLSGYKPKVSSAYNIPEDIKLDPIFEKYKTQEERDRALVGAQKFLWREKLPVPKDANDKETYELIFNTLGRPKDENGYELPTDLEIPKDLPFDEAMLNSFKKVAHQNGILPQQFAGLYKWYMNSMSGAFTKINEDKVIATQEAENILRKKWGAAYPQNVALAKKTFQNFADPKAVAKFEQGLGNDPEIIEFFANIGKVLSEDQLHGKPQGLTMTPSEAQSEINKIKGDMSHPYWKEGHPQHSEAVERMSQLTKLTMVGSG